jgi:hypothetical protein
MVRLSQLSLLCLCVVTVVVSQGSIPLTQTDTNNSSLMHVLDNYFGCKTWTNGTCIECAQGYYFNDAGICCEVPTTCQIFDTKLGICTQCYSGYSLVNNSCARSNATADIYCEQWNGSVCMKCAANCYFDSNHSCAPLNSYCKDANTTDGSCLNCYKGYVLTEGVCVPSG